jgi:hypothetical protein
MRKLNCKDGICIMESLPQRGGGGLRATSSHFLIPISQLSKAIKKRKMTRKRRKKVSVSPTSKKAKCKAKSKAVKKKPKKT